jgi:hypothetical protein
LLIVSLLLKSGKRYEFMRSGSSEIPFIEE